METECTLSVQKSRIQRSIIPAQALHPTPFISILFYPPSPNYSDVYEVVCFLSITCVQTYTTYVTTASNTSLLILHMSPRELHDRQRMYNVTSRGRRKSLSITYSESVFVALGIQHAMRMRYIFNCALPGSTILCMRHFSFCEEFRERD